MRKVNPRLEGGSVEPSQPKVGGYWEDEEKTRKEDQNTLVRHSLGKYMYT